MIFKLLQNLFPSRSKTPKTKTRKLKKKFGTIRYWNRKKGYGFIASEQTNDDVFVHITDLPGRGRIGLSVLFDAINEKKGMRAKNVEFVVEGY